MDIERRNMTVENTGRLVRVNGEWLSIWAGVMDNGDEVWCCIGKIHHGEPPKAEDLKQYI